MAFFVGVLRKMQNSEFTNIKYGEKYSKIGKIFPGMGFTWLTILGEAFLVKNQKTNKNEKFVVCECKCGNTVVVLVHSLKTNNTHSCGCYNIETRRNPMKNLESKVYDDYIEIEHKNGKIFLDIDDYEKLKEYCLMKRNEYFITKIKGKNINIHQLVLGYQGNLWIDHIDTNKSNNRKKNLRLCTHKESSCNKNKNKNSDSKYKGVTFDNKLNKWRSRIMFNGKMTDLGRHKNEIDAAKIYDEAARKYFKEYGRYNFPKEGEQSAI